MNVCEIPVAELIPHDGNMVLLDELIAFSDSNACAKLTVRNEGLFHSAPNLPAWVGIELMAQVIAAWAGAKARLKNEPVKVGFLIGTRKYESQVPWFTAGDVLSISIECAFQDTNGMASFDCVINNADNQALVTANINVYQPDEHQFQQMMEAAK